MTSKLPKPSGSKPPQTIVPNFRLKRRSKSVTDLPSLVNDKPLKDFAAKKPQNVKKTENEPITASKDTPPRKRLIPSNQPNFTAPKTGISGAKRPLEPKSNNDGQPKPKVAKKIPDWDYKGRFHQLNEKYVSAQESLKEMKLKISEFGEIETNYVKIQEVKELSETKEKLTAQCEELAKKNEALQDSNHKLGSELAILQKKHRDLEENFMISEQSNKELTEKSDTNLKDNSSLISSLNTSTEQYKKLRHEHNNLLTKYIKITKNYQQEMKELKETIRMQKDELQNNQAERKRLHNVIQDITGSLNSTTEIYEKLTKAHTDLVEKHNELTEKSKFFTEHNKNLQQYGQKELKGLKDIICMQKDDLQHCQAERRRLHNVIQDLKGNIRVFCRVRPPINAEEQDRLQCCINFIDDNGMGIKKSRESVSQITGKAQDLRSEFMFDKVFPTDSTQEEIFEDLAQLVQSALDGYDVCVFAYGQTGSGKTYTMQGGESPESKGMIPRTIDLIFENIAVLGRSGWKYTVQVSFLEIYNENVRDLLNINSSQRLEIYFNDGKGTTVTNLTIQPIESASELKEYMSLAHRNRATAATDYNEHSSRSHAVTKIYLEGVMDDRNLMYKGSINLVDLAGSESAKQSVSGERLTETKNINKSLATLGDVISALHRKSKHIPYRNSKLTYLLQSCLGGKSKTLMIVNISQFEECFGESLNSLRFAAKVKEVKTASKRNKISLELPIVNQRSSSR